MAQDNRDPDPGHHHQHPDRVHLHQQPLRQHRQPRRHPALRGQRHANTITVINTTTNTVTGTIATGTTLPYKVAITPDGTRLFVTSIGNWSTPAGTVTVIDTTTNTTIANLPNNTWSFGVAVAPNGTYTYLTNRNTNTLTKVGIAAPISVSYGTSGSSIPNSVAAANLSNLIGNLRLIGANADDLVEVTPGFYAPATSFGVDLMVSGSRRMDFKVGVPGGATPSVQVWVDDRMLSNVPVTPGWAPGSVNTVTVDVGDAGLHRVRVMLSGATMGDVLMSPEAAVTAPDKRGPRIFVLGDSMSQGDPSNTGGELGTWISRFANSIGADDYWNGGIGGTGFTVSYGGHSDYGWRAVNDVVPSDADVVIVGTWYNDKAAGRTPVQIASGVANVLAALSTMESKPYVIVLGAPDPAGVNGADFTAIDQAVRPIALQYGAAFVSPTTGTVIDAGGRVVAVDGAWVTAANRSALVNSLDNLHATNAGQRSVAERLADAYQTLMAERAESLIDVGNAPQWLAFNQSGSTAYVANQGDGTVSIIDTGSNTVIGTVATGAMPAYVVRGPNGKIYVSNQGSGTVSVIDAASNTVISTFEVGGDPNGIAFDNQGFGYVATSTSNAIAVFAIATHQVVESIPMAGHPAHLAVTPDGTRLYVSNQFDGNVAVVDTTTRTVTAVIPMGAFPTVIRFTTDGTKAYITNQFSNAVYVVDTATNTVTGTIAVGVTPVDIALSADGTRAYVTNFSGLGPQDRNPGTVSVIDLATGTVIETIPVGRAPVGATLTPDGTHLYVVNAEGSVSVVGLIAPQINTSNTTVGFADSAIYFMSHAEIERTLDEMLAMGVTNVRIMIPWAGIEPTQDDYYWTNVDYLVDAAYERNMGVVGILNATPSWAAEEGTPPFAGAPTSVEEYAEFATLVAQRYARKVAAYEIWNEPNAYFFWAPKPDPEAYTLLLQAAYPAIKAADPDAIVIGGVLGSIPNYEDLYINPVDYLERMYDAGAAGYFDALSFHPYHYTLLFSEGEPWWDLSAINQMAMMHQEMVENGDGGKLIWSTEYGEPTSVVDEATQEDFIADYLESWAEIDYAGPSFIYTMRDTDTDSGFVDYTFGVLRDDWTWKPAAHYIDDWAANHRQAPGSLTVIL